MPLDDIYGSLIEKHFEHAGTTHHDYMLTGASHDDILEFLDLEQTRFEAGFIRLEYRDSSGERHWIQTEMMDTHDLNYDAIVEAAHEVYDLAELTGGAFVGIVF